MSEGLRTGSGGGATPVEHQPNTSNQNEDDRQHDGEAAENLYQEVGHGDHRAWTTAAC
jgi:hypothetical protein